MGPPLKYKNLKTLIIRTDKLGDFYVSLPYVNSIVRTYGKKNVDILVSENIFSHFKSKDYLFNKIFSFPAKNFIKKILLSIDLRKTLYDQIIIFDGKDRSIILSLLLRCKKRIFIVEKRKLNFSLNLFLFDKSKNLPIIDDRKENYFNLFNKILKILNIKIEDSDFKFLKYENIQNLSLPKNLISKFNDYSIFHFDEKWFSNLYIDSFTDISPNSSHFFEFIKNFINNAKQNLIITTGLKKINFIDEIKDSYFDKLSDDFYEYPLNSFKVFLLTNISIKDLEILVMNSKILITCHGPLLQIGQGFSIKIVDILEKKHEEWYDRHIYNKKTYNKVFRKNFNDVYKEILFCLNK